MMSCPNIRDPEFLFLPILGNAFRTSSGTRSLKNGGGGGNIGIKGGPTIGSNGGDGGRAGNIIEEGRPLEAHDFLLSNNLRLRKASL